MEEELVYIASFYADMLRRKYEEWRKKRTPEARREFEKGAELLLESASALVRFLKGEKR